MIFTKTTSDKGEMILFLSIKHTINIVITHYIVYDDICLMVWKINYFILFLFLTINCTVVYMARDVMILMGENQNH